MQIKELTAGVKLSKDFNSHSLSITVEYGDETDIDKTSKDLLNKLEGILKEKLGTTDNSNNNAPIPEQTVKPGGSTPVEKPKTEATLTEVGGAWPSRFTTTKLSCKDKASGEWSDVKIEDLEVTEEGYRREHEGEVFIFKKLTEDEKVNENMPHYRVYKVEGGDSNG